MDGNMGCNKLLYSNIHVLSIRLIYYSYIVIILFVLEQLVGFIVFHRLS